DGETGRPDTPRMCRGRRRDRSPRARPSPAPRPGGRTSRPHRGWRRDLASGAGSRCPRGLLTWCRSIADAGAPLRQELDELDAADDRGARDEIVFVELALLEARRTGVDRTAGLREAVHQLAWSGDAFLPPFAPTALFLRPLALP